VNVQNSSVNFTSLCREMYSDTQSVSVDKLLILAAGVTTVITARPNCQ